MESQGFMKKIVLTHLYPGEMNIYGDMGNIIALRKRLEWRGFEVDYQAVGINEEYDFSSTDIVFGGGGQDKGQIAVADDLQRHQSSIQSAVDNGTVFLLVCGLYQLFGRKFVTVSGSELMGIGVFGAETIGSEKRLIGNVTVQTQWGELVGFENHSGRTFLDQEQSALGRVTKGGGNNGRDGFEGAVVNNAFGTYLHGSLLPKNPEFCDELLRRALKNRGIDKSRLDPLEDIDLIALSARNSAKSRP